MLSHCPFCDLPAERIVDRNDAGVAVRDAYPVSPGHTLIISSRHVGSLFELSASERDHLLCLIDRAKNVLDEQYQPDAYNIGINDGVAAGQTVPHLHIHLIPRFKGDLSDPRGGVRWVIPKKGRLLEQSRLNSTVPPPTAEAQLAFLAKLQRLFAEGDFTATYKFALLISLADLAVEVGADDGAELTLTNRQLAERFVQLYWQHTTPYGTGRPETQHGVLVQNLGDQAAVLTAICKFRASTRGITIQQARTEPGYAALLTKVATVVSAQPLHYLQNFGGVTDTFLYVRSGRGSITLRHGVAYCLRCFYTLVQQLSRTHWIDHIKTNRRNQAILGDTGDLEDFLFSCSRQSLALVGIALRKLDGALCFYCGRGVIEAEATILCPSIRGTRLTISCLRTQHAIAANQTRWRQCLTSKDRLLARGRGLVFDSQCD